MLDKKAKDPAGEVGGVCSKETNGLWRRKPAKLEDDGVVGFLQRS